MPRGSDESWVGKLNEKCAKYKHFEKARFGNACKLELYFFLKSAFFSAERAAFEVLFCVIPFLLFLLLLPTAFVIKHFSDTVQYQSNGFLEKNRDTISKELVNVMRESNLSICRTLISLNENTIDRSGKETRMDGRVKINAAKHLVNDTSIELLLFVLKKITNQFEERGENEYERE